MKWAFWRRRKPRVSGPGRTDSKPGAESDDAAADGAALRLDQAARIRVRMRRRLIGAAALLLGTAVLVPMMLDPVPRPLPDNIPIDIPSERTPFSPRLSLPAEGRGAQEAPAEAAAVKPGDVPAAAAKGVEPVDEPPVSAPGAEAGGASAGKPSEARSAKEGGTRQAGAKADWYVQAAALSSESAARQLSERLSKAGMAPFIERTVSGSGNPLYRVRLGPYASREAAAKARRHLRSMSVDSNVVRAGQADR